MTWHRASRRRCAAALLPLLLRAEPAAAAADGAAPVLDLPFRTMPVWRHGDLPWPPVARPFDDPGFVLSAGLASGLRPAFERSGTDDAAWASLPDEAEAYPDGDAIRALSLAPFSIRDGTLAITAAAMPTTAAATLPGGMQRRYLSGAFNTYPFGQTYGVFEVTARVPKGAGLWPAFWLLPVDMSWPPEIDIAEILGGDPATVHASLHSTARIDAEARTARDRGTSVTDDARPGGDLSLGFHRYAVDWGPETIAFSVDGTVIARHATPADMHKPFYLVVDLAVGGPASWPGAPGPATRLPATLAIREIRIWRHRGG